MKRLRVYVDTSVVGGCLDDEFADDSNALFHKAKRGDITLLVSDLVYDELSRAPVEVQQMLAQIPNTFVETLQQSKESLDLRDKYVDFGVVPVKHANDAHHVAIATLANADVIASWNFKHLVHFDRIRLFNAVNFKEGYRPVVIHSPKEIV